MDEGAWQAPVHGVAKNRIRLSDFTFPFHFPALEKEMATHSSVPAWRIPGTGEPGGLPPMGSHRVRHDWSELAAAGPVKACGREGTVPWGLRWQTSCLYCSRLTFSPFEGMIPWRRGMATHSSTVAWRIPKHAGTRSTLMHKQLLVKKRCLGSLRGCRLDPWFWS